MKTRTSKAMGMAAAVAAIAVSLPLAITAQAEPMHRRRQAAAGPAGQLRSGAGRAGHRRYQPNDLAKLPVGQALATIPSLSTFYSAISGGLNPEVNIVPVLDNGPYVVFAPNNDAFAKLDPAQLEALKTDPAALSKLDYYHVFLGLLGPDDVQGSGPPRRAPRSRSTARTATSRSTTPPR